MGEAGEAAEPHELVNALSDEAARAALTRCCGSVRWVAAMMARRPFPSTAALMAAADEAWAALGRDDFLEAFAHHPAIGSSGGGAALKETAAWSREEQARVADAGEETWQRLRAANEAYRTRFGYIFIICATGKSGPEMLSLLEGRLHNDPERELAVAAGEQAKITKLRLAKLRMEQLSP
jgi:2-oxo-4-hydroxy-4-carboxy-5-ureidoimidazoline decarboxylase